jgi:cysteine desulfurase family protein (TIGR01976 family)
MSEPATLDIDFCRGHFPALANGWVFMENAGGTLVPTQVTDRLSDYTANFQVQPGEGYEASEHGADRIAEGREAVAALIAADVGEIIIGPSTTSNVYVLSHALRPLLAAGDEIIVTNQDHEANNGAWRALESRGMVIREWRMNSDSDDLEIEDLKALLNERTKLVCFTHCSNIVGLVHDVKTIAALVHEVGALVCVDGVAYVPHRRVDVHDLDVDFYLYSPYKLLGPHMGVLYGKRELLSLLANQSHYFLDEGDYQRKLCPGGYNYELTAAAAGITDYFDAVHRHHFPGANVARSERIDEVMGLFADHETKLAQPIETFLRARPGIHMAGQGADSSRERVGVMSFYAEGRNSGDIIRHLHGHKIGVYADDFYAARCIDALGARERGGVIRPSLAHYNSTEDVTRLLDQLDQIL